MWVDWGPRAMATAQAELDRHAAAAKGEQGGDELDDDGRPMVMSG